jgi:hypothetical protein
MRKIVILAIVAIMGMYFSSCKKEETNGGATPQETCLLKSTKGIITEQGNPNRYEGFVFHRDNDGVVNRLNFLDSTTGNEDPNSYVLLSYSSSNLTDIKIFQGGAELFAFAMTYNANNKVEQRFFDLPTIFGDADINQKYFYDSKGRISYSIRTTTIDNVPNVGKVVGKDSALYLNYNAFNRPEGVVVYTSTTTSQGTEPYEFEEEFKYEYDSKGNRTKISIKEDVADPFEVTYTATFDLEKNYGAAEEVFKIITKLFVEDWDNPNPNDDDFDKNLKTSETEIEDGKATTTTTTFTINDKGNPAETKDVSGNKTTTNTFTYECK